MARMRVAIGGDHRGVNVKSKLLNLLRQLGHEVVDEGTNSEDCIDYPDIAGAVGRKVSSGAVDRGILVCGTGIGMGTGRGSGAMTSGSVTIRIPCAEAVSGAARNSTATSASRRFIRCVRKTCDPQ